MSERTTEEKIRICTRFLQRHGYQVIWPKTGKESVEVERLVASQRDQMLKMGGASVASLLSIQDVRAMLGCSKTHINTMVLDGRFPSPAIKGKRYTRWRLQDVQGYVAGASKQTAA